MIRFSTISSRSNFSSKVNTCLFILFAILLAAPSCLETWDVMLFEEINLKTEKESESEKKETEFEKKLNLLTFSLTANTFTRTSLNNYLSVNYSCVFYAEVLTPPPEKLV